MDYFWSIAITLLLYGLWRYFTSEDERNMYYTYELSQGCLSLLFIVGAIIFVGMGFVDGTKEGIFGMISFFNKQYHLDDFLYVVIILLIIGLVKMISNYFNK